MVEVLVQEREEKMQRRATQKGKGKKKGGDRDLPNTPPSSPSSTHYESSNTFKGGHKPQIELDVKFDLSKYCGELNDEKLDEWI